MEFRLLGPVEVLESDRPVPLPGQGQRALLAVLLLHANEVVSADRLLEALWPDEQPASGAAALQVRVSQLRKALGPAGARLVTRPPGYLIEVEAGELDVHRFEGLVADAETAPPADAAALLREALELWHGTPLSEFEYAEFARPAIGRLEELRLAALERRIEADLALGRHDALVGELDALVAEQPLRERLRSQQMVALYRSGRQADALAAFQAARSALVEQLGIEPGPVLRQLERAILGQDPSLDLEGTAQPERSLLVVSLAGHDLDPLVAVAAPLARRPERELLLASLVASVDDVAEESAAVQRTVALLEEISARAVCFTTLDPAADAVRLAAEQEVDLLVAAADARAPLADPVVRGLLDGAPCDVALLVAREEQPSGPVLVPFAGGDHDWTAVELGAWIAGARSAPLVLAGPREVERDASRILASASLAVQRAFGVAAIPRLVEVGAESLLAATRDAALVVAGLPERWSRDGLGETRGALCAHASCPVLLTRSGIRPGGLAPREAVTRFTWSLRG